MARKRKSLKQTLGGALKKMKNAAAYVKPRNTLKPSPKASLPADDWLQTDDMNAKVKSVKTDDEHGPKPAKLKGKSKKSKFAKIKAIVQRFRNR